MSDLSPGRQPPTRHPPSSQPPSSQPPSPPARRLGAPRRLDAKLLVGLILVLGSITIGTRVVASVDDTQLVWVATADLAVGTPLAEDHLERAEVRLTGDTPGRYLDASSRPTGYLLTRPVSGGELVPADAVARPETVAAERRLVTVPVQQFHYPDDLRAGELVDVYVTTKTTQDDLTATLVAPALTVAAVHGGNRGGLGGSSSSGAAGIELSAPTEVAIHLVEALQSGPVDLVRVPSEGAG